MGLSTHSTSKPGLPSFFTYARLSGKPLFGDYRDLGEDLPAFDDIAALCVLHRDEHAMGRW